MQKVFGGLLLGCGILIAGLSGLCVLFAAGTMLMDAGSSSSSEMLSVIPAVLFAGGIPLAIGIGLFFGGRALINSAPAPQPEAAQAAPGDVVRARPIDRTAGDDAGHPQNETGEPR